MTSVESRDSEPASAHHLPDLFIILARLHISDRSSRRQRLRTMAATVPSGKREFIVGIDFGTTTSVLAFAEKPKPGVDFDHNSIKLVTTQVKPSYHLASLTNEQSMQTCWSLEQSCHSIEDQLPKPPKRERPFRNDT